MPRLNGFLSRPDKERMDEQASLSLNPAAQEAARKKLEKVARNGGDWFFWIAALSALNTAARVFGQVGTLAFALGITQVIEDWGVPQGWRGTWATIAINLPIAGIFVVFGWYARKWRRWAFLAGLALYAVDALVFVMMRIDLWALGLHYLAWLFIFRGSKAAQELEIMIAAKAPGVTTGVS